MRRGAAFTLVEVLVSLALVLIVLPVAMRVCSMSTALASDSRRRTEAAVLAEGAMARLVATGEFRRGAASGTFAPDYPDVGWSLAIADHAPTGLLELDLTVQWPGRGGSERTLVVTTLAPREPSQ